MRAVLVMLDRGVVPHRFLLFVRRRLDAVSDGKTQTGLPHYRHSRPAQRHSLESCAVTMPAREMRFASLSWGQSSMKRGRTWPARARTVRTADGMKGRLMDGSIGVRSVGRTTQTHACVADYTPTRIPNAESTATSISRIRPSESIPSSAGSTQLFGTVAICSHLAMQSCGKPASPRRSWTCQTILRAVVEQGTMITSFARRLRTSGERMIAGRFLSKATQ